MTDGALMYFMLISQGYAIIFCVMFLLMLLRKDTLINLTYIVMCLFMFSDAVMSNTYTMFDLGLITCFMLIGFNKVYVERKEKIKY